MPQKERSMRGMHDSLCVKVHLGPSLPVDDHRGRSRCTLPRLRCPCGLSLWLERGVLLHLWHRGRRGW